jgi:hypothetical protein
MKCFVAVSLAFLAAACSQLNRAPTSSCRGEFRFEGIPTPPLRQDAARTILEFVALDETVQVVNNAPRWNGKLTIAGRGHHCDDFGNSFLASKMREFQGLSYRRIQ